MDTSLEKHVFGFGSNVLVSFSYRLDTIIRPELKKFPIDLPLH